MTEIGTRDVPQANSLTRVGDLLALVDAGIENARLSSELSLVTREVLYYKEAACILGFADFEGDKAKRLKITHKGHAYLNAKRLEEKREILARAVRRATVFRELLNRFEERRLDIPRITKFLQETTGLNRTTAQRRAHTILAWLRATSPSPPRL